MWAFTRATAMVFLHLSPTQLKLNFHQEGISTTLPWWNPSSFDAKIARERLHMCILLKIHGVKLNKCHWYTAQFYDEWSQHKTCAVIKLIMIKFQVAHCYGLMHHLIPWALDTMAHIWQITFSNWFFFLILWFNFYWSLFLRAQSRCQNDKNSALVMPRW